MNRTKRLCIGATLLSALALSACAQDADVPQDGSGGGGGEVPEVADGPGTLVAALYGNPETLNSGITADASTVLIGSAIFDSLLIRDNDFEIHPHLATEWEVNDEATEYTLHLRDDVTWHDGTEFTAEDVEFNINEIFPLHATANDFVAAFGSTEVIDEHTVQVNFDTPFSVFPQMIADLHIIPRHIYEDTDYVSNPANQEPIGTGAYIFEEQAAGDYVRVTRNDDYWAGPGDVEEIVFTVMPDGNARTLAMQSGDLDYLHATFLDITQYERFEDAEGFEMTPINTTVQNTILYFNLENEYGQDYEVRRAIYHAIDRQNIADLVFLGTGEPSKTPIPNQMEWAVDPDLDYNELFNYDPDEANAILDAAGYERDANGTRFSMRLAADGSQPKWAGLLEIVQANLAQVGIEVEMQHLERGLYVSSVYETGDFDMAIAEKSAYADPSLGVARVYISNPQALTFYNPSLVYSDEVDAAFQRAAEVVELEDRQQALYDAQAEITDYLNALPIMSALYSGVATTERWSGIADAVGNSNFIQWHTIENAE